MLYTGIDTRIYTIFFYKETLVNDCFFFSYNVNGTVVVVILYIMYVMGWYLFNCKKTLNIFISLLYIYIYGSDRVILELQKKNNVTAFFQFVTSGIFFFCFFLHWLCSHFFNTLWRGREREKKEISVRVIRSRTRDLHWNKWRKKSKKENEIMVY